MPDNLPVKSTASLDVLRVNLLQVVGAAEEVVNEVDSLFRQVGSLTSDLEVAERRHITDADMIASLRTQIATYESATHTETDGTVMAYAARLATELHKRLAHPDYEYTHTEGQRKTVWDDVPKAKDGEIPWERNTDHHDGFERFDYHEESYWRRLKPVEQEMCDLHTEQPEPCITCEAGGY